MICNNCNKEIQNGSRFCPYCGTPQGAAAPQAAPQPPALTRLYMDAKGLNLFNYTFEIKDEMGNLRYRAGTVSESMIAYTARIWYPDNSEALTVRQQKKMTLAAMNFDIVAPNGALVTEALQNVKFASSEFFLPAFGITVSGDLMSLDFAFYRNNQMIGRVSKKFLSWGDSYELEFADKSLEQVLLAAVLVVEISIIAARQRRRRR